MPQFDFTSFFVQAYWLTLGFFLFFFVYLKFILVQTFTTLRAREKLLAFSLLVTAKVLQTKASTKILTLI